MSDNEEKNIGGYDNNAFLEKEGIRILESVLENERTIYTRFSDENTIPNTDGTFELLSKQSRKSIPIATFKVQIKCTNVDVDSNGCFDYDCDTKIINYAENQTTLDPIVIFVVVVNEKKVYFKYVSQEYVRNLDVGKQNQKRIKFSEEDCLLDIHVFYRQMINIFTEQKSALLKGSQKLSNKDCIVLQNEVDRLNDILDHKLSFIKATLFKDIWKFGIAYNCNDDIISVTFYTISFGSDSKLVTNEDIWKNFDYPYMACYTIKGTVKDAVDQFVSDLVKRYFEKGYIPAYTLPTIVLEELSFMFIDKVVQRAFCDDVDMLNKIVNINEVSIEELQHYWYALIDIVCDGTDNLVDEQSTKDVIYIANPYDEICKSQHMRKRYIEHINAKMHFEPNCIIRFQGCFPYGHMNETIKELKKRQVQVIHRVWPILDYKTTINERKNFEKETGRKVYECFEGIPFADYQRILNDVLKEIPHYYSEFYDKIFPAKTEMVPISGYHTVAIPAKQDDSYMIHRQPANMFSVQIVEYECIKKRYEEIFNSESRNVGWFSCGRRTPISKDGIIIYHQLRYLLYLTMQANGFCHGEIAKNYDDPICLI